MIEIFEPWYFAFRRVLLHAPSGPPTPKEPLTIPDDLRPPETVPDEENGFVTLVEHLKAWPPEREYPVDFRHRIERIHGERKAAERALTPYRPLLEGLDPILDMPRWQATITAGHPRIDLRLLRRFGEALALSGALDPANGDLARTALLGQRLRRCGGAVEGFYTGIEIEQTARATPDDLPRDRQNAVHSELSRLILPSLTTIGPWDSWQWPWPGVWDDRRRVQQWLLSGHPKPYDPQETANAFVENRELLTTGSATEIRTKAIQIAQAWPEGLRPLEGWSRRPVPMAQIRQAKPGILATENPYGALLLARSMIWIAGTAEWVEKLSKPRSAVGDAPPAPAEAS